MEQPSSNEPNHHIPDTEEPAFSESSINDKLLGLNLESKSDVDFSAAVAESERICDSTPNGQHKINDASEGNGNFKDQINKEKRRGSLERYKPPTINTCSKEEREKHRRRGHFGETKGPDNTEYENTNTINSSGRPHGRYRGKGRNNDRKTSPSGGLKHSNEPNDGKERCAEQKEYGERPVYKSQLSKDWADYSFEDDNEQVAKETDSSLVWGEPSDQNEKTEHHNRNMDRHNSRYGRNLNQHNDYRHQQENTDLREKLNERRASNTTGGRASNHHNQRQENGNFNGYSEKSRHQQKPFRGNVQNDKANNSDRYSNDRSRGYWERDREEHNNHSKPNNHAQSAAGKLPRPKKNTENFNPCYDPPEMRILFATPGVQHYDRPCGSRDVIIVRDLFISPGIDPNSDLSIYNKLLDEIQRSGVDERLLWQSWHGDSHLIADDKRSWKKACPTFSWIVEKLAEYFRMDVQATRLNWYRDSTEWKPFHHDAAAMKPDKARTQNMTVGVSFGAERDAAFEHSQNRCVISMPQPNGTVYTFGRDVNILWRHGIPQMPPELQHNEGRISIIAWGWVETFDM